MEMNEGHVAVVRLRLFESADVEVAAVGLVGVGVGVGVRVGVRVRVRVGVRVRVRVGVRVRVRVRDREIVPEWRELLERVDVHDRGRRADGLHCEVVAEVALHHARLRDR